MNHYRKSLFRHLSFLKFIYCCAFLFAFLSMAEKSAAQNDEQLSNPEELKKLSVEQLMDISVTLVSRVPQKLSQSASAIQVITQDDIKHSAATNLPEALRLATNLQATQLSSRHWIISARGFNATFSNKLLVMIDGRTVYSPLFAGVFWDAQDVLLEDVDHIEVISGPGGALWGANAVNGVINIITKSAKDTKGLYVSGAIGTFLKDNIQARYGGDLGSKISYRVYSQYYDRNNTILPGGKDNADSWRFSQSGFVMDWNLDKTNAFNIQGNFYAGRESKNPAPSSIDGQNIMGKWSHSFSDRSNLIVRGYVDRTWRIDIPSTINDKLITYDLDLQHDFPVGRAHHFLWGLEYRFINDRVDHSTQNLALLPPHRNMHVFSGFAQDEISFLNDRFKVTVGTKVQQSSFTSFEVLPNIRLAFTPYQQNLLWAAVSRSIRSPSRIDVDYYIPAYPVPPTSPSVAGGPDFKPEKLIAYEAGYRLQTSSRMLLSLALFYNRYNDLYSVEPLPGTLTYQIQNGAKGFSNGLEVYGNFQISSLWHLRSGYTYFFKKLENKPGNTTDPATLKNLGSDAKNQALIQSVLDLPHHLNFAVVARYISSLSATSFITRVPPYFTLDVKMSWKLSKQLEISAVGQNLLDKQHVEVGGIGGGIEIPRGFYARIIWRYKK